MKAEQIILEELIKPVVEGQGYEFLGITFRKEQGVHVLRITIDKKINEGFISHEDCSKISKEVSLILDVNEPLPGRYTLEVSSPGIQRPLVALRDYVRFIDHLVKLRKKGISLVPNDRKNFTGWIRSVNGEQITLEIEDTREVLLILFDDIEKANLVVRF